MYDSCSSSGIKVDVCKHIKKKFKNKFVYKAMTINYSYVRSTDSL